MPKSVRVSQNPLGRYGAVMGICLLAGLGGGVIVAIVSAVFGEGSLAGALIVAAAVAVSMTVGMWVTLRWWRGLDEAAQEAHKWAWWWGATLGLAGSAIVLFTWTSVFESTLTAGPKDLFLSGALVVVLCQTVGYGLAWAAWWLKRR